MQKYLDLLGQQVNSLLYVKNVSLGGLYCFMGFLMLQTYPTFHDPEEILSFLNPQVCCGGGGFFFTIV